METAEKGHQRRGSRIEKCVTFGEAQVFSVDNCDRKGPSQQMAADRARFQRRIRIRNRNLLMDLNQVIGTK